MSDKPLFFKLPLASFDTTLLPQDARTPGTARFKSAVTAYFAQLYAAKGEQAVVAIDDDEVTVFTVPARQQPLAAVLGMLQEGRIREALPYLETLAKALPDDVDVLFNLGLAYSELAEYDQAIIRLKKAVQLKPAHAHAWTAIGVAYQRMGRRDMALEPMRKAVEADPRDGHARRNLGAVLLGQGHAAEALDQFRKARAALPHDPQTLHGLASALEAVGGEPNLQEADELYLVVIQRFPASPVAEHARQARTRIAQQSLRAHGGGSPRPDVVAYIAQALATFKQVGPQRRQEIAVEIALKGQGGLDINDPEPKHTLKSLPGQFSALHLVSIMYAAFRQIDPGVDIGLDLRREYEAAVVGMSAD
jgi:tetratricopeptide (TPR) repeat protein